VTPSQAVAILDDEVVPETELFDDEVIIAITFDEDKITSASGEVNATDLEATQPPILTPINLEYLIIVTKRKKDLSRFLYRTKYHLA